MVKKNKPFINLIVFILFLFTAHAQDKKIDSLINELKIHKEKDTTRVNILNTLANKYCSIDIDRALVYIKEAKEISNTIDYSKGIAKSIYIKGRTLEIQSNYEEALIHYNNALKLYKTINFKNGISDCLIGLGDINSFQSNYDEAIIFFNKAIKINETIGDQKAVATGINNIGIVYTALGNYKKAITYYKKALKIYEEVNYKQGIANSTNNLGTIYHRQGNYSLALEYLQKGLSINEEFGDTLKISVSLMNIGVLYYELQNYDKAIVFHERSLKITTKNDDKKEIATITSNLGLLYHKKKEYLRSINLLKNALKISEEINFKIQIALCLNNLGDVYLSLKRNSEALKYFEEAKKINLENKYQLSLTHSYLGIAKVYFNQKKNVLALTNALKSKKLSSELKLLNYRSEVSELLSTIYQNMGKYENAYESHQQFKTLNDSIFNKKNIEKIAQIEYDYKYKQALDSASIRELKLTKTVKSVNQTLEKSQRNLFLGIIAFLTLGILLVGIIFFFKLRHEKSKTQNIAIEQKLLRSQMTPHFIFNSLSVLQGMILNKEDKKSIFYLSKFSKLLRITLENSRDKMVPLHDELEAVNNYLELQNLEENEAYQYTILVDDTIDEDLFKIPPMLIQPFIENAIEHAFENQKEHKKIDILLKFLNKALICTITDNGIGIDAQKKTHNKNKKSLATTITSERIQALSKDFKVKGSVIIEDRKKYNLKGTIVTLVIPYKMDTAS